jgi:hypothetical protein
MYFTGRPSRIEMKKARRIQDPIRAFDSRAPRSPVKVAAEATDFFLRVPI